MHIVNISTPVLVLSTLSFGYIWPEDLPRETSRKMDELHIWSCRLRKGLLQNSKIIYVVVIQEENYVSEGYITIIKTCMKDALLQ